MPLLVQLPFAFGLAVAGEPVLDGMDQLLDFDDPTPLGLAYLNLALAGAIPVAWLISRVLHGLRPGWLASVRPRIRWRWMVLCFGISIAALFATLVVSAMMPAQEQGAETQRHLNDFTSTTRDFLLVVLLLTPLQAAGEEYAFRGYLTQAFGAVFGRRWVAVLLPALLFALAHGSPERADLRRPARLRAGRRRRGGAHRRPRGRHRDARPEQLVGLRPGAGVRRHGLHAQPAGGTWWSLPVTLTQSLVYLGLVLLAARRTGLRTTTETARGPGVLVAVRTSRVMFDPGPESGARWQCHWDMV